MKSMTSAKGRKIGKPDRRAKPRPSTRRRDDRRRAALAQGQSHAEELASIRLRLKDAEDAITQLQTQLPGDLARLRLDVRRDMRKPRVRVDLSSAHMEAWPEDRPLQYNGSGTPCDMWTGPCCCGAWHIEGT